MKLTFLGATGTVTGSKYLVAHGDSNVLVDCGLFQGFKQLRLSNWAPLPIAPADSSAVVLTHAHLDHSGYLPLLVRQGFKGKVHCSEATYQLCRILLPDSGHLQEEEAEYANRHRFSKHRPALPLYTREDAERALRYFAPIAFDQDFEPAPGVRVRFASSGHILGSAFVTLTAGGRAVVFSGDLGRPNDLIMRAPVVIERADYLVIESTYGDRLHDPADPQIKLGDVIRRTAARGGVVVVPAFAVGRAQAMLYLVHLLKATNAIPAALPVYLDSPMAVDVTAVYHRHRDEHRLTPEQCDAMCRTAIIVNRADESRELNTRRFPMVIIAASGMATGDNLSAHADYREILERLGYFKDKPRRTFITHGEPAAADALRWHIGDSLAWDCQVPDYLESDELA